MRLLLSTGLCLILCSCVESKPTTQKPLSYSGLSIENISYTNGQVFIGRYHPSSNIVEKRILLPFPPEEIDEMIKNGELQKYINKLSQ